jgi:hypothetical protein
LVTVAQQAKDTIEPWTFEGRGPFIHLWKSNTKFYPFDVQPEDIHIEDIAWGLATECRFGGHCPYYSVAEHSIYVSDLMCSSTSNHPRVIELQLIGLLHDAAEAYLKDIPRPLKYTPAFAQYRELEWSIQKAVYSRFQLDSDFNGTKLLLRWADNTMLATEKHELFPEGHPTQPGEEVLPPASRMRLGRYIPQIAYNLFMARYTNLVT